MQSCVVPITAREATETSRFGRKAANLACLGQAEEEARKVVTAVKDFWLRHKRLLTPAEFQSNVAETLPSGRGAEQAARI